MKSILQKGSAFLAFFSVFGLGMVNNVAAQECFETVGPVQISTVPSVYSAVSTSMTRSGSSFQTSFALGVQLLPDMFGETSIISSGPFAYQLAQPRAVNQFSVSEGDYVDQIVLSWKEEFAGARVSQYRLLRNGSTLATLPGSTTEYIDQNVVAGRYYEYSVIALNEVGESLATSLIGFVNPNGTVTGNISTTANRVVPDVEVRLTPTLGSSLEFDGVDDAIGVANAPKLSLNRFTLEAYIFPREKKSGYVPILVKEAAGPGDRSYGLFFKPDSRTLEGSFFNGTKLLTVSSRVEVEELKWSHIALVYDGTNLSLYLNGVREASEPTTGNPSQNGGNLYFGKIPGRYDGYRGLLDDVRIWNTARTGQELIFNAQRALSAADTAKGLVSYWKMDENTGNKVFDITENSHDGIICGPVFKSSRAPVSNAAFTDLKGNYVIDGINYGTGVTFTAIPSKITQIGRSVFFNGTNQFLNAGSNLDLNGKSFTVELWARRSKNGARQILVSQGATLAAGKTLQIGFDAENKVFFSFGNNPLVSESAIDDRWHHLAFSYNATSKVQVITIDGEIAGEKTGVNPYTGSGNVFFAKASHANADFFTGILDEARVWTKVRSQADIQGAREKVLAGNTDGLAAYWRFNEGSRDFASDQTGRSNTALFNGMNDDNWVVELPYREEFKHTFSPEERKVSLNNSTTAVNSVNFTNTSLIKVSGYVRYFDSDCFADSVQIYVNGKPVSPPVFTDKSGKFEVEFEPGVSAQISPNFENHRFAPAMYEIVNIAEPIANVVFDNMETRQISGQVGGGMCLNPIGSSTITLRSTNGCYEKTFVTDDSGFFTFDAVPPLNYTVSADHINPVIDAQLFGQEINAVEDDVDGIIFRYRSMPEITTSWITSEEKGALRTIQQLKRESVLISILEPYIAGNDTSYCPVDTGRVSIQNDAANSERKTLPFKNGQLVYTFVAGKPNILAPYTKDLFLDVIDDLERTTRHISNIVVEGNLPEETRFTTTTPSIPFMILHDPAGDNSFSFIQKDSSFSTALTISAERTEGSNVSSNVSMGTDFSFETGIGYSVETEINLTADISTSVNSSRKNVNTKEQTFTFSSSETISTSAADDMLPGKPSPFVGDDGDVYIGGAMNMIYGITRVLEVSNTGEVSIRKDLIVVPEKFNTTFVYTEGFIKSTLIPSLQTVGDQKSVALWQQYIAKNAANKANAAFIKNLSFDAGASISQTETTEVSSSTANEFTLQIDESLALEVGLEINGVGFGNTVETTWSFNTGKTSTESVTKATTFGYVLADNDQGDYFTVDVKKDPVYGSPVFKTVSGASSCPHEPNTFARDRAKLVVRPLKTVNVPPDEPAIFEVTVQNLNLDEYRDYAFTIDQSTNPFGAAFSTNGSDVAGGVFEFGYAAGGSNTVILEITKGPLVSEYSGINLIAGSICGLNQSDTVSISFSFQEACSNVAIAQPEQGWAITGGDASKLPITFYDYDNSSGNIQEVRVQYRRVLINGVPKSKADVLNPSTKANDWIDIQVFGGSELTGEFAIAEWETAPLGDGIYEIRVLLSCFGSPIKSASQVVRGIIDRNAPRILGLPEPSDGVLNPGDQIYVQFNEEIDPNYINPLTDILLFNAETGNPVDRNVSIFANAIGIVPLSEDRFLENRTLRVEINKIKDLRGNEIPNPITWEFLFDKSPVRWTNGRIDASGYLDQAMSFVRSFQNSGGSPISFELGGLPSWLTAFPTNGTLAPGTSVDIRFNVSRQLGAGEYVANVRANTAIGNEPLAVKIRLLCGGPEWELNPANFQQSMNIVAELFINGEQSFDTFDQVGIFVGNELRGIGSVEYVPGLNKYHVYATVYSNSSTEPALSFRVWDASACIEFGSIDETFTFTANTLVGTPRNPVKFTATQLIVQPLTLNKGWTWTSFNSKNANMSVSNVLKDATAQSGDVVRGQTAFSVFSPATNWVGTLDTLRAGRMYQMNLKNGAEIITTGKPIDLVRDSIPLAKGWNWLGYNPTFTLGTNDALRNLVALEGDIIKSQTQFAVYLAGTGWIGNLTAMTPLRGYLLNTKNGGRFVYPDAPPQNVLAKVNSGVNMNPKMELTGFEPIPGSPWTVNPHEFQYSMSVIAELSGNFAADTSVVIAAFSGEEIRGIAKPLKVETLGKTFVFLTVYSNKESGEEIAFQVYNPKSSGYHAVPAREAFASNAVKGSIENPLALLPVATSTDDARILPKQFELAQNYPNPFNGNTQIRYALPERAEVSITLYNILGQRVATIVNQSQPAGFYTIPWMAGNATANMSSGTYILEMKAGSFRSVKKLMYLK